MRFSKDKTPYKTHLGLLFWLEYLADKKQNPCFYVHLDQQGLHDMPPHILLCYREHVSKINPAQELHQILEELVAQGFKLSEPELKKPARRVELFAPA